MKIRNGFVSNSSSSSFTCDVCGANRSGMDAGLEDAKMNECSVGHIFCDSHLVEEVKDFYDLSLEDKKKRCLDLADDWNRDSVKEMEDEEDLDLFYEENEYEERYNIPKDLCPCCSLTDLSDDQILEYLLFEKGVDRKDVEDEIRTKFVDYDEMKKVIKE